MYRDHAAMPVMLVLQCMCRTLHTSQPGIADDRMSDWWISVEVQSRSTAIIIQLLLPSRLLYNCHYCWYCIFDEISNHLNNHFIVVTWYIFSGHPGHNHHLVSHARPLRKRKGRGKEESGDHVYIELFSWNAIIAKNVKDIHKNCKAGHMCVLQVWRCQAINLESDWLHPVFRC